MPGDVAPWLTLDANREGPVHRQPSDTPHARSDASLPRVITSVAKMSDGASNATRRVVTVLALSATVGLAACGDDGGSKNEAVSGSVTTSGESSPSQSASDETTVSTDGDDIPVVTRQKDTPEMVEWLETARPVLDERFAAVDELNGLLAGGPSDGLSLFCLGQSEAVGTARSVVTPVPNPSVDGLVTAYLSASDRLFAACGPGTPEALAATAPIAQEVATLQRTLKAELLEYGA